MARSNQIHQQPTPLDPDLVAISLRKLEKSHPHDVDSMKLLILKKLFEEILFPTDIGALLDWFEEYAQTKLTHEEMRNLLEFVRLHMPPRYQVPKLTIIHLVKNCSLSPPTTFDFANWKKHLLELQSLHPNDLICSGETPSTWTRLYQFVVGRRERPSHTKVAIDLGDGELTEHHLSMTAHSLQYQQEKQSQGYLRPRRFSV